MFRVCLKTILRNLKERGSGIPCIYITPDELFLALKKYDF